VDEQSVNQYIDYNVTKKILQKYLSNARESKFTSTTQDALTNFIRAAFQLHILHAHKQTRGVFTSYKEVLEEIKNMNIFTQSLDIPTRGKSDILRLYSV
jgi:hypothetical protein